MVADLPVPAGPRRRILMTCDAVGGVWRYALDLSRVLCRRGHRVTLAVLGPAPGAAQCAEAAAIAGLTLRVHPGKLVWMDDPWQDVAEAGEWLLRLADAVRPDLIHANDFGHVSLAWPAPVLCVAHSCVCSWWRAVHQAPAPSRRWGRYRAHVHAALDASSLVVAPSRAMAAALQAEYGLLPAVQTIPNGACAGGPAAGAKQALIFAAGRLWDEAKNLAALADVAPGLPWPVCIAGPDRAPDGTRAQLGGVRQLGVLPRAAMRHWFGKASIYALPARYEPFGLSVLEAAQAGCALVLGDIPSQREFWNGAALFVDPDDTQALSETLLHLTADGALRGFLQTLARSRARGMTAARMADDYLDAYARLLRASEPRRAQAFA